MLNDHTSQFSTHINYSMHPTIMMYLNRYARKKNDEKKTVRSEQSPAANRIRFDRVHVITSVLKEGNQSYFMQITILPLCLLAHRSILYFYYLNVFICFFLISLCLPLSRAQCDYHFEVNSFRFAHSIVISIYK